MLLIRKFEERVERLFSEGRIVGTAHTCIGQEAVAVGVASALEPRDAITSTHRGHGHFIARGAEPGRVMAELFGRADGYSRGRGGSQMMMDPSIGFYGTNGITGASVAFAAGLALNSVQTSSGRVAAAFFGDGSSNQGVIHEALNIASLWKLPVIGVCEINGYAMSTPTPTGLGNTAVSARAAGLGITGMSVDGNDIEAVYNAVSQLAAHARAGEGPALLDCVTYRLSGHSRGDQRVYRTREEEAEAWKHEPIARLAAKLLERGLASADDIARFENEAVAEIDAAVAFAEASKPADTESISGGATL